MGVLSLATKTFGDGGPISFMQKIIKEYMVREIVA